MKNQAVCDVTSGIGRHPCLLIEPSEKHFIWGCGLNAGLNPSQAETENPHHMLFFFFPLLGLGAVVSAL